MVGAHRRGVWIGVMRIIREIGAGVVFFLAISLAACNCAQADNSSSNNALVHNACMLDQPVSSSFIPKEAHILVHKGTAGDVRKYPAEVLPLEGEDAHLTVRKLLLGGLVSIEGLPASESPLRYTFFLKGDKTEFAATVVKKATRRELEDNSQNESALAGEIEKLEARLAEIYPQSSSLDAKLKDLRGRASVIAGVDEIIDLQMELEGLKGYREEKSQEIDRLRALIELGRNLPEPDDLTVRRQELSVALREAAQVTALAERLSRRQKKAAYARFQEKLRTIKQTQSEDAQLLARRVLELRKKRREFENRLGITSADREENF